MKKRDCVFICLFISCSVFCQTDSLLRTYDEQFVYRYGYSFMKGGNRLSFADLRGEFSPQSLSFDLYEKSKKDKTISIVLRYVSIFAVIGVGKGVSDNNRSIVYGFLAGQFVTALASQAFYNKSTIELDRALQTRNRELLFPGR